MHRPATRFRIVARNDGTLLAGFFTGALFGASLAMVLTPASQEDMRDVLRAKARDATRRAAGAAPNETL